MRRIDRILIETMLNLILIKKFLFLQVKNKHYLWNTLIQDSLCIGMFQCMQLKIFGYYKHWPLEESQDKNLSLALTQFYHKLCSSKSFQLMIYKDSINQSIIALVKHFLLLQVYLFYVCYQFLHFWLQSYFNTESFAVFQLVLGAGREATWPARKKKWPRPWPAVQAAKKRPVHLTANDRAWAAKPRPTDGPVKWPAKF
ncbi:hypothetical protein BpHYR1_002860 [Brachionus plicatilis]|uniref:Uncharacterized protein n=1 Tax=Brachionus plicatilis TaxID=10195 RepID=A0A3M7PEX0_BRAPC|nr:hypothetical protein BpHYR1_002860 [Brachionus plicatilis]